MSYQKQIAIGVALAVSLSAIAVTMRAKEVASLPFALYETKSVSDLRMRYTEFDVLALQESFKAHFVTKSDYQRLFDGIAPPFAADLTKDGRKLIIRMDTYPHLMSKGVDQRKAEFNVAARMCGPPFGVVFRGLDFERNTRIEFIDMELHPDDSRGMKERTVAVYENGKLVMY